jgi:hypothetical protein
LASAVEKRPEPRSPKGATADNRVRILPYEQDCLCSPRIELLRQRADAGECDLLAKAQGPGEGIGFYCTPGAGFASDRRLLSHLSEAFLRASR